MGRLFYLDALAGSNDCSLSKRRLANELTPLFIWLGRKKDRVLSRVKFAEDPMYLFPEIADDFPSIVEDGYDCNGFSPVAWSSTLESIKTFASCKVEFKACYRSVIDKIGGRVFRFEIADKYGLKIPDSILCEKRDDVISAIMKIRTCQSVIKPMNTSAGAGFVHIRPAHDLTELKIISEKIMKGNDCVLVEPWLDRIADLSSAVELSSDGKIISLHHQRNMTSRAGAYWGNLISDNDPLVQRYEKQMTEAVKSACAEIFSAGYFGSVGFDHFVYQFDKEVKLAAAIDINPRMTMAMLARQIRDRLAPSSSMIFRFISRKRHRVPPSMGDLRSQIGDMLFDGGRGVTPLSPTRIRHNNEPDFIQPFRSAYAVFGRDIDEVISIDAAFKELVSNG